MKEIELNEKEIARVQSGQTVAKALDTDRREEIAIFGIVHMNVTQEYFLSHLRSSLYLDTRQGVLQNGLFSTPPKLSDISNLNWENDDLEKIRDCDPSECTARFPGGSALLFHQEVDWSFNKALQRANELMRRLSVDYIAKYQRVGDDALTSYYRDGKFWSVKEGTRRLLSNSSYLHKRAPELASYLQNYPHEKNPNAKDIFYWQKAEFGLQPVIRFNHVVILPVKISSQIGYMVASKMLYANHYFRDGLELRSLIPDGAKPESKGLYFLVLNRSHVDGMTGFKGLFIRDPAVNKSVEQLENWLISMKARMEKDFQSANLK